MIPSLLERYLLLRLARASAIALVLLTALYLSFDLGDQGRRLATIVGWKAVLAAALLRLPLIAAQLLPAALLLGGALATARLQQMQELQALRALGFSTARLLRSAALLGLGATTLMALLLQGLAPPCEARADAIRDYHRPSPLLGSLTRGSWRRHDGGWLQRQDAGGLTLRIGGARVLERYDDLGPTRRALGFSAAGIEALPDRIPGHEARLVADLAPLGPRRDASRPEALSSSQLRERIRALRRAGLSERVERLVLHLRYAYPLLGLVAALLLLGLLDGRPRSHAKQLARAVLWIGLLWGLVAGAFSAGRAGALDPGLAAWLPIAIALLSSVALFAWQKRAGRESTLP